MKEPIHLCLSCKYAKMFEAEGKNNIYISFGCKSKDTDLHNLIVRLPISDYIIECPKYKKASLIEKIKRKLFWWI